MNIALLTRIAILKVFVLIIHSLGASGGCQEAQAAATRGIVDEQPAEGRFVETDQGYLVAYRETIPGTGIMFEMVPIAGGEYVLGSPASETGRKDSEGPQLKVQVAPMWVAKCEVTWAEYRAYLDQYSKFKELSTRRFRRTEAERDETESQSVLAEYLQEDPELDGVTCPTPIYDPSFTFEAGKEDAQPAVTMTQYAAKQYTKWLSALTGNDYRLPSEIEWEYAARAGSHTAYSFGDDPLQLEEYAWYAKNSEEKTHPVGTKKPNAWGLHDMHGNVAEWVLDGYDPEAYAQFQAGAPSSNESAANIKAVKNLTLWPTELYPRVYRGGCWYDQPDDLRSASRFASSDEDWTVADPNLPVSPWWFTEAETLGLGMRIVRPLKPLDAKTKERVWEADFEYLQLDVEDRMAEGRGAKAVVNPKLPAVLKALEEETAKVTTP